MEPFKAFYSIREVQEITKLSAATLRYWETRFPDLHPHQDAHGNRFYTQADIELIQKIKFLRDELKITRIEAIQNELNKDERHVDERIRAIEILQRIRQQLSDIRSCL